jgi:hypothetical protein
MANAVSVWMGGRRKNPVPVELAQFTTNFDVEVVQKLRVWQMVS